MCGPQLFQEIDDDDDDDDDDMMKHSDLSAPRYTELTKYYRRRFPDTAHH